MFNKLFFPNFDPLIGSLVALGTYAAGFVARPIGGLVFGIIGDRSGRKVALVTTLLIVGIATFVIGLMPTYEIIGTAAPLYASLHPPAHGFGIGGEQGNAILITFEHAPLEFARVFRVLGSDRSTRGLRIASRPVRGANRHHVGCDVPFVGMAESRS